MREQNKGRREKKTGKIDKEKQGDQEKKDSEEWKGYDERGI